MEISPSKVAEGFRQVIQEAVSEVDQKVKLVGILASNDASSHTYSQYMRVGCSNVGVEYEELTMGADLIEDKLKMINDDSSVTGVIVYYPIFGGEKDSRLRQVLSPLKDVEGLHQFWLTKLYSNERTFYHNDTEVKALLPCTPLAVIKLLEAAGEFSEGELPLSTKTITIFNRSEVVGRPLAYMLANDGAKVFSFDLDGVVEFNSMSREVKSYISRREALAMSDIVITGVPNSNFDKVRFEEINKNACCVNFSSFDNFSADVRNSARVFVPRVGPVTVTMCLRNITRMAKFFR